MNLEVATENDFKAIAEIYDQLSGTHFNWNFEKAFDELKQAKTVIIKQQEKVAAFLTFRDYSDRFEISAIGTDAAFLRQGLALKLLSWLAANAAQQKLSIWLEVHENNQTALNLYLKFGFKVLNSRKRYYSDGGNALVMQYLA